MKSRSAFDCGLSLDNALGTATQMMPSVVPSRLITSYTHVETEERFVSGLGITAFCELFAAHTLRSGSRAGLQCNRRSYLHTFSRQRTLAGCVPGHTVPGPIHVCGTELLPSRMEPCPQDQWSTTYHPRLIASHTTTSGGTDRERVN